MEKGRLITVFNQDIAPAVYSEEQKLSSRRQDSELPYSNSVSMLEVVVEVSGEVGDLVKVAQGTDNHNASMQSPMAALSLYVFLF